jgi:pimeloyl-ACP methyl ester carboxylesterase
VTCPGTYVTIDDTRLWVVERGSGSPVIVLHGGPGLDHHEFADYLDPLADTHRLLLIDQRSQGRSDRAPEGTWTLERMAQDVIMLALALGLGEYAVLGHSYGAFVALQNAVDYPGIARRTIVSGGIASSRFLLDVDDELARFGTPELRARVVRAWEREATVATQEEFVEVMRDEWPFNFADPEDPRIGDYVVRAAGVYTPEVLRHFATAEYGGIEVESRLGEVSSPVLVLAGRHDRVCTVAAAEAIAAGIPRAELHVFEASGHMAFVEQQEEYLDVVRAFLAGAG